MSALKVVYFAYRYPVLSQTFIQREVAAVSAQGISLEVQTLHAGKPMISKIAPDVPVRRFPLWRAIALVWRLPVELIRDPSLVGEGVELFMNSPWRGWDNFGVNLLGVAVAFLEAERFRQEGIDHFHGIWATGAATAAAVSARLCGKPFSFGAHAFDIYRHGGDAFLDVKLQRAKFVHTTTETNVRYLTGRVPSARVVLSRRGLDCLPEMNSFRSEDPVQLLSVARLVEKKGLPHQIQALRELKRRGVVFRHRIVGDGPLRAELQRQISEAGLESEIQLTGALPHDEVERLYSETDLFLHTGLVDSEGDRDGLPNVIPEAMARGIAVISSPTPGADEAVLHEKTGWVADPRNSEALAGAIEVLVRDSEMRGRLGCEGRRWVEENFLSEKNALILVREFKSVSP